MEQVVRLQHGPDFIFSLLVRRPSSWRGIRRDLICGLVQRVYARCSSLAGGVVDLSWFGGLLRGGGRCEGAAEKGRSRGRHSSYAQTASADVFGNHGISCIDMDMRLLHPSMRNRRLNAPKGEGQPAGSVVDCGWSRDGVGKLPRSPPKVERQI